jgi:hypothetical protein
MTDKGKRKIACPFCDGTGIVRVAPMTSTGSSRRVESRECYRCLGTGKASLFEKMAGKIALTGADDA